jgi:hypothetical protein
MPFCNDGDDDEGVIAANKKHGKGGGDSKTVSDKFPSKPEREKENKESLQQMLDVMYPDNSNN